MFSEKEDHFQFLKLLDLKNLFTLYAPILFIVWQISLSIGIRKQMDCIQNYLFILRLLYQL